MLNGAEQWLDHASDQGLSTDLSQQVLFSVRKEMWCVRGYWIGQYGLLS